MSTVTAFLSFAEEKLVIPLRRLARPASGFATSGGTSAGGGGGLPGPPDAVLLGMVAVGGGGALPAVGEETVAAGRGDALGVGATGGL